MMNISDPPKSGILHRQHGQRRLARAHGLNRILERATRERLHFGVGIAASLM